MKLHPTQQDSYRIIVQWERRLLESETEKSVKSLMQAIADDYRQAWYRSQVVELWHQQFYPESFAKFFLGRGNKLWNNKRVMDFFKEGNAQEVFGFLASLANGDFI